MKKITLDDIEKILSFKVSKKLEERFEKFNLYFDYLNKNERDNAINDCINQINSNLIKSGRQRELDWQKGWDENLNNFLKSKEFEDLIPKYFAKYNILRWQNEFIKSLEPTFEYNLATFLIDSVLDYFIEKDIENIYEFGCGTGHNLVRFSNLRNTINYFGFDWAKSSQKILSKIQECNLVNSIEGINFDYFNIDKNLKIKDNSVIFTVNSLEQTGESYKNIIDFWMENKPKIIINFETDESLLDKNILLDNLSILYAEKRNYLKGYMSYLEKLQSSQKIEIVYKKRFNYGSKFIESFSVIVWKVL